MKSKWTVLVSLILAIQLLPLSSAENSDNVSIRTFQGIVYNELGGLAFAEIVIENVDRQTSIQVTAGVDGNYSTEIGAADNDMIIIQGTWIDEMGDKFSSTDCRLTPPGSQQFVNLLLTSNPMEAATVEWRNRGGDPLDYTVHAYVEDGLAKSQPSEQILRISDVIEDVIIRLHWDGFDIQSLQCQRKLVLEYSVRLAVQKVPEQWIIHDKYDNISYPDPDYPIINSTFCSNPPPPPPPPQKVKKDPNIDVKIPAPGQNAIEQYHMIAEVSLRIDYMKMMIDENWNITGWETIDSELFYARDPDCGSETCSNLLTVVWGDSPI